MVRPRNSVTHWSGDLLRHSNITILCFLREGGRAGFFKTSRWFLLLTLWCIFFFFLWPIYTLFWWFLPPICTLSIHCRREKKLDLKKNKKNNFFFFWGKAVFILFLIESLHSCQMICSRNVLFQFIGQMNNSVNHINGIKLFSCTEPPSRKVTEWMGWAEDQIRDYNFSVASLKNVHSTHWELVAFEQVTGRGNILFECWVDSVYGSSFNDVPWKKLFSQ